MDVHSRKPRSILQDQENIYNHKTKSGLLPSKPQLNGVRGALGDLSSNVQICRDNGMKILTKQENDKKAISRMIKSSYSHVQSKIDTGLAVRNQPSARPPLRREESTAGHAARALISSKNVLKEKQIENVPFQQNFQDVKKSTKIQSSKIFKDPKKITKSSTKVKTVIKEPIESMCKLNLDENVSTSEKSPDVLEKSQSDLAPPLPEDIEDIDAGDVDKLCLLSTYVKDIYYYLMDLEVKYSIQEDHLRNQIVITPNMRATLIDWLVDVQRQFSLLLETFQIAVGIIDSYLQVVPNIKRNQLQLVGVTALYIASKYEEIYAPDVEDFVYVTDHAYTKHELFACERDILKKIGYCLARPIPLSFLRRFVKAADGTAKNHHLAKYFVDLSLVEYSMAHYRPSELASAAVCLSLYLLSTKQMEDLWTKTLSYYTRYSLEHIRPIVKKIAKIVVNVENSRHKAVYNKYQDIKLAKVSSLPQLKSKTIIALAEESDASNS